MLEPYSSAGGAPILFDTSGNRLSTAVYRQKPDFVGPDGVNTTFLGFTLASDSAFPPNGLLNTSISECQNDPSYPNFFGTSAATPHAAGIAALLLQAVSSATPDGIYQALRSSALAMGATSPNYQSGYGFIQAKAALTELQSSASSSSTSAGTTNTSTGSGGGGAVDLFTLLGLATYSIACVRRRQPARRNPTTG
jgi:subtilisin family serine protease